MNNTSSAITKNVGLKKSNCVHSYGMSEDAFYLVF